MHCGRLPASLRLAGVAAPTRSSTTTVPGASKPSKLLLQYYVELPLRVLDGLGGSGGRRVQARCGSPGVQGPSATGMKRHQSRRVQGLLLFGERLPALAWSMARGEGGLSGWRRLMWPQGQGQGTAIGLG